MAKANEVKRGTVVELNGKMLIVRDIEIHSPTARGATTLYKMRFSDIITGAKVEERFKGEDNLNIISLMRRPVSFSYIDGDEYIFMDNEDYTPYSFKQDQIEEELLFIPEEGLPGLQVLTVEDKVIGLELPQTVNMEIIETAPALKGASATSRTKPAKMKTGLTISVPEYLSSGEKICIHIAEKRYMGRAE